MLSSRRGDRNSDELNSGGFSAGRRAFIGVLAGIGLLAAALTFCTRATAYVVTIPEDGEQAIRVEGPTIDAVHRLESRALASGRAPGIASLSGACDPSVNLPVCTPAGQQIYAVGTSDGAGGAIYVWADDRPVDPGNHAQHVLSNGTIDPSWPADGVQIYPGVEFLFPVITSDGAGGAYIVLGNVSALHLLSTGVLDPTWPAGGFSLTPGPGGVQLQRIVSDGAGGAFATWTETRIGTNRDVFVHHLIPTGLDPAWPVGGINLAPSPRIQALSVICSDGAGGALVAWRDARSTVTGNDIYVQHVLVSGVADPSWPVNGTAVCTALGSQGFDFFTAPGAIGLETVGADDSGNEIVSDGAGGCLIVWGDFRTSGSTGLDVYAHHVLASGAVDPAWPVDGLALSTAPGDEGGPFLVPDGAGGAIATWSDLSPRGIFAQHLLNNGTVGGPANGLQLSTAGDGSIGDTGNFAYSASDGSGGAFVSWSDDRDAATRGRDVYMQHVRVSPSFGVDPAWPVDGVAVSTAPGDQVVTFGLIGLVANGASGPVIAWDDARDFATNDLDIYAQGGCFFTIATSAGAGGSISPNGTVTVKIESDQAFTIAANTCYLIADVKVDGASVGAVSGYTFTNVQSDHTIAATFTPNPAPVASITGPPSGSTYPVNTSVAFSGAFTDNVGDSHTAQWYYDAVLASDPVTITGEGTASATISTSHTFTAAGVYKVGLVVTDQCGGGSSATTVDGLEAMVVIFDPNAGFLTGGGWINSPAGAFKANPTLTGKANFGFVSKYLNGSSLPTGETEFQFKPGNLNFHSTSYDWLIVDGYLAQYKGSGTVNGSGNYGLLLTAIDGNVSGGGGQDRIRVKIWNKAGGAVIYDNLMGSDDLEPTTPLGGGSIVIHTGGTAVLPPSDGGEPQITAGLAVPERFELAQNQPNPFEGGTEIRYALAARSRVELAVFDLSGRRMATLASGAAEAGRYDVRWAGTRDDGAAAAPGLYFLRLQARSETTGAAFTAQRRMILTR